MKAYGTILLLDVMTERDEEICDLFMNFLSKIRGSDEVKENKIFLFVNKK